MSRARARRRQPKLKPTPNDRVTRGWSTSWIAARAKLLDPAQAVEFKADSITQSQDVSLPQLRAAHEAIRTALLHTWFVGEEARLCAQLLGDGRAPPVDELLMRSGEWVRWVAIASDLATDSVLHRFRLTNAGPVRIGWVTDSCAHGAALTVANLAWRSWAHALRQPMMDGQAWSWLQSALVNWLACRDLQRGVRIERDSARLEIEFSKALGAVPLSSGGEWSQPFTTRECAQHFKISEGTWRNWHAGRNRPSSVKIEKLATGRWRFSPPPAQRRTIVNNLTQ